MNSNKGQISKNKGKLESAVNGEINLIRFAFDLRTERHILQQTMDNNENAQQNIVRDSINDNMQMHQVSLTISPKSIMNEIPKPSVLLTNSIWVKNAMSCFNMS